MKPLIVKLLILILKIISFQISIKFRTPKNIKIIVFDVLSLSQIYSVIGKQKYFILFGRLEDITEIYINLNIIKKIFKNSTRGLSVAYNLSLIETIKPKLIVTVIDNSKLFHNITRIIHEKIPTLAIQLSNRPEIKTNNIFFKKKITKTNMNKKIFLDTFFAISQYDIDFYKKNNISIKKGYVVGSLALANAVKNIKKTKVPLKKDKFDICIISDGFTTNQDKDFGVPGWEISTANYLKNLIKIIKKNNLKFIFCIKRKYKKYSDKEMNFYKKYLEKDEVNFLLSQSSKRKEQEIVSPTYAHMLESNLVISVWSTLLRENMQLGRKSLCVDTDPNGVYTFPLNAICRISEPNFKNLEKRVLYLLSITNKKYLFLIKKKMDYVIFPFYGNTIKIISNYIKKYCS